MPTYDYECQACGHRFEHFQSISSPRLKTCPECRRPKLHRLVGAGSGLIFRGTGFYVTDYQRASPGDSAGAQAGDGKGDAATEASKKGADSPAASPPSKSGAGGGAGDAERG